MHAPVFSEAEDVVLVELWLRRWWGHVGESGRPIILPRHRGVDPPSTQNRTEKELMV